MPLVMREPTVRCALRGIRLVIVTKVALCFLFLHATVVPSATLAADHAASSPSPITLGYIGDLTGIGAFFSVNTERGATLARETLSVGRQAPIRIVFEDLGGKVSNAVTAAIKLLTRDKVDAIICDLTAPCTAIASVVDEAKKVLVYHSPATSIAQKYPSSTFRNFIDYRETCRALANYWKRNGISEVGSLNGNQEFGERCFEGVEAVYPKHFAYRNNPGDDLRAAALAFKDRKLRHVIFTGFDNDLVAWLKHSTAQNVAIDPAFIELLVTETLWKQLEDIPLSGLLGGFDDLPHEFQDRLRARFPDSAGTTSAATALAYNAVVSLVGSIDACPERKRDCIAAALRTPRPEHLLGFRGWRSGFSEYPIFLKQLERKKITKIRLVSEKLEPAQ